MDNGEKNKGRFLDRISRFLTDNNKKVFIVILIITAIFAVGAFRIKGEVILQDMLPYDHTYLKLQARFAEVFGSGGSTVAIAMVQKKGDIFNQKTLEKVKKMTEEVELLDEVYRLLTVSIASQMTKVVQTRAKGEIGIESLMFPDVPKDDAEMALLKKNIFSNPAYSGILVSEDGTATLLLTEFKENISYLQANKILRKLVRDYSDEDVSIHVVGYPALMGWVYALKPQILMVFAISIIAIMLVLWLIFRSNILGAIVVLANAVILTIWGLGFVGFTGMNFSPLLYVVAFLVGARMVGNAQQITYRYFEELQASGGDRKQASYETMRTMFIPNFAAVTTDAAGFLVLLLIKIALMQQLAVIMTFWMLTIILTGFLVPTICSLVPLKVASEKWAKESCEVGGLSRTMMKITSFSMGPQTKYIVAGAIIAVFIFCFWQTSKLKIGDPTPGSPLFYQTHPYNQDQQIINTAFDASSENFQLFYEGERESVYDPIVLNTFEEFKIHMATQLPDIYKSASSIIDLGKMVNLMFHDGDQVWYQLPEREDLLTSLVGAVRKLTGQATLARFVDRNMERAQITLYFADHTSDNLLRIRDAAYAFFKDHPMKLDKGEFKLAGGRIGMEIALNEEMKRSHAIVDAIVLSAIFILCALTFRSIVAGIMLTLPLVLANSVAAAYMGLAGIGLSINTLPVAAIGVGVGVDFAIYLYSRAQEEFPLQGGDWMATITQSICTCGKAVVYTGLTIILPIITWYFFSSMKFQAQVGFFLALIMATNVVLTMTLHPLMLYIFKPKFISRSLKAG